MKSYTKNNVPKKGNAKKIWDVLKKGIEELHYNPNLYGKGKLQGWGTWACTFDNDFYWCGIERNIVYLEQQHAPFRRIYFNDNNVEVEE